MQMQNREELLAETLREMQSTEPEGFEKSALSACDMIDRNAEHTVGMWEIWDVRAGGMIPPEKQA